MAGPANTPHTAVVVHYDGPHARLHRTFRDPHEARRFYAAKLAAGKNPTVTRENWRLKS